jgi:hypothetical protein
VLIELAECLEPAVGGWRFLFSSLYRARKRRDWRHEHTGYMVLDVIFGTLGVGVTISLVIVASMFLGSRLV